VFDVEVCEESESQAKLVLRGELDVTAGPSFRAALYAQMQRTPVVTVDLNELDFLDSSGLGILVGALKYARSRSGDVRIVAGNSHIKHVLEITGLRAQFESEH
jgi:anti-sigma B factor antagonist